MDGFQVRFEQKRGHCLVLEGDPPVTRAECDDFQLRMLQSCEVPGLLKLDIEEIDGSVSFRYSLAATRMLSQALRADRWSMTDFMTALCRLAEVMEDCGLHVLEPGQMLLEDDFIFAGEGWQDLRFVYVPSAQRVKSDLTMVKPLIVRWMMHVVELDGAAVQQVLRMAASPDFKPALLRRFARQYLSEQTGAGRAQTAFGDLPDSAPHHMLRPLSGSAEAGASSGNAAEPASSPRWRWFQPPAGEPHSLSGLLGDDPERFDEPAEQDNRAAESTLPDGRRRIWLVCGALGLSAIAWRLGYAEEPGMGGLIFSAVITLAAAAAVLLMWNKAARNGDTRGTRIANKADIWPPVAKDHDRLSRSEKEPISSFSAAPFEAPKEENPYTLQPTGRLSREIDRTQLLDAGRDAAAADVCFLEWESAATPARIALDQPSFVIGRSKDVSRHVDETHGVSRAHAELLRTEEGWTAKDLGSRNGTKLNDMPMVPYESYRLQAEDRINLAGSRYRFKCAK